MDNKSSRKDFFKAATAAAGALGAKAVSGSAGNVHPEGGTKIRLGIIGTGKRGRDLLETLLHMEGLEYPALCDINPDNLSQAKDILLKKGYPEPEGYSGGEEHYKRLVEREDLDAVLIAAPWQ